ncbi:MAG TPA: Bor family protein [Myxococcaceae bacterium]|jgi:hypothetical protein|nr:Bor family protein [Myxococcaceae bacterium]
MRNVRLALLLAGLVPLAGCYHAVIETGKPPGNVTIDEDWASGFFWGLVPPPKVDSAAKCPGGVSKVETQHSFLNGLIGAITLGIYTPIQINVTCAAAGTAGAPARSINVTGTSAGARQAALERAARLALETGEPVAVRF